MNLMYCSASRAIGPGANREAQKLAFRLMPGPHVAKQIHRRMCDQQELYAAMFAVFRYWGLLQQRGTQLNSLAKRAPRRTLQGFESSLEAGPAHRAFGDPVGHGQATHK